MSYGIGLALLFLAVGNAMFGIWANRLKPAAESADRAETIAPEHRNRIKLLPVIILALMLVTIAAEAATHWSMLVLVSLLAILFPVLWVLFTGKWAMLKSHLVDYRDKAVPIMNNEIIMYISAGFFGQSLRGTSFGHGVAQFMNQLAQVSFVWFALFILATMICVTFLGIHQVVIVTVLATQMDPAMLGTSKEILAMVIMLAWAASSVLSPVNPMNLMVSGLLNKSSIEVGLRDNGPYLFVVCAIGIAILTLIH